MNKTKTASDPDAGMTAALQSFIANNLAIQPEANTIAKNDMVMIKDLKNPAGPKVAADYLPISVIQNRLDEVYNGLWSAENFNSRTVANEIVGSLDLKVFHPIAKIWISRPGAAAVMIQMKSTTNGGDGDITNIRNKITNTLVKDYPHLLSECIKNAAKSLGLTFGRDLNRKYTDSYFPFELEQQRLSGDLALVISLLEERSVDEGFRIEAIKVVESKDKSRIERLIKFLNDQPKKTDLLLKALDAEEESEPGELFGKGADK
jgi:hypothetical protein